MKNWRALVLLAAVAAVGATGTFVVGVATGMGSSELRHLAAYVVPALLVTVAAMWVTGRLLARASLAPRFIVVGALWSRPGMSIWILVGSTVDSSSL